MLKGEQCLGSWQTVGALLLSWAEGGQEAVHQEQALMHEALCMLWVQPHRVQRYRQKPVWIRPSLQQRQQSNWRQNAAPQPGTGVRGSCTSGTGAAACDVAHTLGVAAQSAAVLSGIFSGAGIPPDYSGPCHKC